MGDPECSLPVTNVAVNIGLAEGSACARYKTQQLQFSRLLQKLYMPGRTSQHVLSSMIIACSTVTAC